MLVLTQDPSFIRGSALHCNLEFLATTDGPVVVVEEEEVEDDSVSERQKRTGGRGKRLQF
jgi:hypothetical protein